MRLYLSLLLFILSNIMFGQSSYQLEGTVGTSPISLSLSVYPPSGMETESRIMGRYYYKKSLKDIAFRGSVDSGYYLLDVQDGVDKIAESFKLKKVGNSFVGTWCKQGGKSLSVNLRPIDASTLRSAFDNIPFVKSLKTQDLYDYARLCNIELRRDSISSDGSKSFVWLSEKHCQASFFRLGNGFSEKQRKAVNPVLDQFHIQNIINQLQCTTDWYYNNKGDGIDYSVSITYLDKNLIGFYIFQSYFCGGAHPDFGGQGYLFNLEDATQYELTDIYALDTTILYRLLDQRYDFRTMSDDDCDYTDLQVWEFFSWSINREGISFTPSFPRVFRSCEESFFIPFSDLEPYKKTSFLYSHGGGITK